MYDREYIPDRISELKENEIFVFGSNLAGAHDGGAARFAYERFGAVWGEGVGLHGQTTPSLPCKVVWKPSNYDVFAEVIKVFFSNNDSK